MMNIPPVDFYQRIVLDNTICEYNNFISMLEGLEKTMPALVDSVLENSIAEELKLKR